MTTGLLATLLSTCHLQWTQYPFLPKHAPSRASLPTDDITWVIRPQCKPQQNSSIANNPATTELTQPGAKLKTSSKGGVAHTPLGKNPEIKPFQGKKLGEKPKRKPTEHTNTSSRQKKTTTKHAEINTHTVSISVRTGIWWGNDRKTLGPTSGGGGRQKNRKW